MNCLMCKYMCKENNKCYCCYENKVEIPAWLVSQGYPAWCPYIKEIKDKE